MNTPYIDDRNPSFRFWALSEVCVNRWDETGVQIGDDFKMSYPLARLIVAIHRSVGHGIFETENVTVNVTNGWADVLVRIADQTEGSGFLLALAKTAKCLFPIQGLANLFDGEHLERLTKEEIVEQIVSLIELQRQRI